MFTARRGCSLCRAFRFHGRADCADDLGILRREVGIRLHFEKGRYVRGKTNRHPNLARSHVNLLFTNLVHNGYHALKWCAISPVDFFTVLVSVSEMAKQDDFVRYTIRVPADLYARIQEAAAVKSINAVIVEALEDRFPAPIAGAEFIQRYLIPIVEARGEFDQLERLRFAQKAAQRIDPDLTVWISGDRRQIQATLGYSTPQRDRPEEIYSVTGSRKS